MEEGLILFWKEQHGAVCKGLSANRRKKACTATQSRPFWKDQLHAGCLQPIIQKDTFFLPSWSGDVGRRNSCLFNGLLDRPSLPHLSLQSGLSESSLQIAKVFQTVLEVPKIGTSKFKIQNVTWLSHGRSVLGIYWTIVRWIATEPKDNNSLDQHYWDKCIIFLMHSYHQFIYK